MLQGLREARDPITRKAYQYQIRSITRAEKQARESEQLQKWASGQSWTFSRPHRLPGPIHVPETLNEQKDRGTWGNLLQDHMRQLYTATDEDREYTWAQLNLIHKRAFSSEMDTFLCHPQDIRNLIAEMPPGKSGGADGLPSQALKYLTQPHHELLAKLFQEMANNPAYQPHQRPDHWNTAIVTLLAKTPQSNHLDNFRPISLIPQLQKLYSKWLYAMIRFTVDECIPPTQHGFRPRRQAPEIHHMLGKLQEMGQEWRLKYIVLKVDIRKAFDTISRGAILCALRHTPAHPRLIWAISRELLSNKLQPQLYGITTPTPVVASKGVKQGSPESGLLYCLTVAHFLGPPTHKWEERGFGHRVGKDGQLVNNVSFADDIQLLAKHPSEMSEMYSDLTHSLAPIGLQVNPQKTQYVSNVAPNLCKALPGDNKTGSGMVILGKLFDTTDTTDRDLARKEAGAWTKFRRLLPVLRQKSSLKHRLRILQSCVLQSLLWASESWHITKKRMAHLRGIHLRMLRRMIVPPAILQGLALGERIVEHSRYVRGILHSSGFELLDKLWLRRFWRWAGHVTRLPLSYPCAQWHSYRDHAWWKNEQSKIHGQRHMQYDANISRWESPLVKYSNLGKGWKGVAKNREAWQKGFAVFWENINKIWHRARSPPTGHHREEDREEGQNEGRRKGVQKELLSPETPGTGTVGSQKTKIREENLPVIAQPGAKNPLSEQTSGSSRPSLKMNL